MDSFSNEGVHDRHRRSIRFDPSFWTRPVRSIGRSIRSDPEWFGVIRPRATRRVQHALQPFLNTRESLHPRVGALIPRHLCLWDRSAAPPPASTVRLRHLAHSRHCATLTVPTPRLRRLRILRLCLFLLLCAPTHGTLH